MLHHVLTDLTILFHFLWILFIVFGAFLGGPNLLGDYWPVLLILLGLWFLIRPLFRSRG